MGASPSVIASSGDASPSREPPALLRIFREECSAFGTSVLALSRGASTPRAATFIGA